MLSRRWTNSHRCSWITVYVSCCNAQMNLIVDTMTCTCIVMHLSICQLHSCNLFTQHVSYLFWRDTTSERGPQSILLQLITQSTTNTVLYIFYKQTSFSTLYVLSFVFSKPKILTTSLFCWGKVSWLCCVQVPRQLGIVDDTSQTYL